MKRFMQVFFGSVLVWFSASLAGQAQTTVVSAFNPDVMRRGYVAAMVRQANGKVIIAGKFSYVNEEQCLNIARLNVDGSLDATWTNGANFPVYALATDGTNVYAGGGFTQIGGQSRQSIAKLDADTGAVDATFTNGAAGSVYALELHGTNLYAGGAFMQIGGQSRNYIAKLNVTNGAADATFTNGAGNFVRALATDGTNVYAGGEFTQIGGQSRNYIARLNATNGAADAGFTNGANSLVRALELAGTNLYVGGDFFVIGGQTRGNIAKLNATNGVADQTFTNSADGRVLALALAGTNLYIGGEFWNIGASEARECIAKLDVATGAADPAFTNGANDQVYALAMSGTNLYAGGQFTEIGGSTALSMAKLQPDTGAKSASFTANLKTFGDVLAIAQESDGKVILGGWFDYIDGTNRHNIARLNADGSLDATWTNGANLPHGADYNKVYALALAGSNVYVAGGFTEIGGQSRNGIAKLDLATGAADSTFTNGLGVNNGMITALAVDGNNVYVGGNFNGEIGGQSNKNYIAKLDAATGAADATFTNDANGFVNALATDGTNVYAGGQFTEIGGQSRNYIARLNATNGAADADFTNSANGVVSALAMAGANLYVGGGFTQIGGQSRNYIARLNVTNGAADATFTNGANLLLGALAVDGTNVYAGGWFTQIGGQNRNCVAKLDAATGVADPTWDFGTEDPPAWVTALTIAGNNVYVGGTFMTLGGLPRFSFGVITLLTPPTVTASDGTYTDKVQVAWDAVSGAMSYDVYRNTVDDSGAAASLAADLTTTNYDDTSAEVGVPYYYWVKTKNGTNTSAFSASDSGFRGLVPTITAQPQSLSRNVGEAAMFSVTATGTAPLSYQWQKDGANIGGGTATNYTIAAVSAGDAGGYRCVVTNMAGAATSTVASLTVNAPLAAPTNVLASDGTYTDKVAVSWSAVTNATGYGIWRHTTDSSNSASTLGETSNTSYDDTSASEGTTYYYWVKATNASLTSDFSSSDSGWRSLSAPEGVTATDGTYTDKIRVTWNSVTGATSYEVWRNTSDSSGSASKLGDATDTTYDDTSATPTTTYYYWIKAKNSLGVGGFSEGDSGWRRSSASTDNADSDLDGDGLVDLTVYHEESGYWYMLLSGSSYSFSYLSFGGTGYEPVPADFDGDGKSDLAVYHEASGYWFIYRSTDYGLSYMPFGGSGYEPVPADFDGDGKSDLAVYCESGDISGYWFIYRSSDYGLSYMPFGGSGYEPVPADFDGDGKSDLAVYCESGDISGYWFIYRSSDYGLSYMPFGGSGYEPVPADFDGDGQADVAVYHESSGYWYIWLSGSSTLSYQQLGESGYSPVPGDYDGDGKADLAVYHESSGYWYILLSESGTVSYLQFGGPGYEPAGTW